MWISVVVCEVAVYCRDYGVSIRIVICVPVYNNISFYVKNSYKFVTSGVPASGACMTVPPSGYALATYFNVSCENFTDPNLPLSHTFVVAHCSSGPGL